MDPYRNGNSVHGKNEMPRSARRTVANDPFSHRTGTDPNYSESKIAKDNDDDMITFVQALKTIHEFPIEHLQQLLLGHNTGLYGQERDTKWAEARNWQEKYKILEQSHEDLQQKFNKIDSEMKAVKDKNERMDKESKFHQAQLHDKDIQLQEQEQGRHWQVEYKNLEVKYKELQINFDQHQMMVADKTKIENEHETLKSMFSSKEQELIKEKSEKSQLLRLVKQLDTESNLDLCLDVLKAVCVLSSKSKMP